MTTMRNCGDTRQDEAQRPPTAEPPSCTADAPSPMPAATAQAVGLAPTVIEWMPVPGSAGREDRMSPLPPMPPSAEAHAQAPGASRTDALTSVRLREGELVDRTYRVERALGMGGMGVVALARDERLDRRVAIKFIKPDLFCFPEMRTFFHNEARAMARVSHPNVLQVYAFGEHEGTPYFVMEYVEGRSVDRWLRGRQEGTLPDLDEAMQILEQACRGVSAIHAAKTVHRDLKPSNLLIDDAFRVAVGDLGVARILESGAGAGFVVGSASYMAPEAALGEDEATEVASVRDVYALGCIAYELFTGRPPFVGETDMKVLSQHVMATPAPPSDLRPQLSKNLDDVVLRAMAKEPSERYATVDAFRAALVAAHTGAHEPERILIADDDPDWRTLVRGALAARFPDAVIDEAIDGGAALAAFKEKPYSVVLVDLEMPEIDGAGLTAKLRAIDASERTPIIVLTAAGGPREWQRLHSMGADAFLVKPVDADDVELVIRRAIRSRHGVPSSRGSGRLS